MGDCLWTGKTPQDESSHLGQLSLKSICGMLTEYHPVWLALRQAMLSSWVAGEYVNTYGN